MSSTARPIQKTVIAGTARSVTTSITLLGPGLVTCRRLAAEMTYRLRVKPGERRFVLGEITEGRFDKSGVGLRQWPVEN